MKEIKNLRKACKIQKATHMRNLLFMFLMRIERSIKISLVKKPSFYHK